MDYKLYWSDEALKNLDEILEYLSRRWTEKEINRFKEKLSNQLNIIVKFPQIFPKSQYKPRLRKAVLSRQTIIFYEIKENVIFLLYLFHTHKDPNNIQ